MEHQYKESIKEFRGHISIICDIALTSDNEYLISGSGNWDGKDCTIKKWSIQAGSQEKELAGHTNFIDALAVTKDSNYIISSGQDCTLSIWSFANRCEEVALKGFGGDINDWSLLAAIVL